MKITICSGNPHKIEEINAIIAPLNQEAKLKFASIQGMNIPEPEEPYSTFMQNAKHKAKYYAGFTKGPTLSEDSGLCLEALDNYPGVYTKNFVEEVGGIENAYKELEQRLQKSGNYNAHLYCAAVVYLPDADELVTSEGKVYGKLSFPPRGSQGFAFDPIFMPDGYDKVMAELGYVVKNRIGHRAIAIAGLFEQLKAKTI